MELAGIYPELTGIRHCTLEEAGVRRNLPPLVQIAASSTSTTEARPSTGKAKQATGGPNHGGTAPEKSGRELARPGSARVGSGRARRKAPPLHAWPGTGGTRARHAVGGDKLRWYRMKNENKSVIVGYNLFTGSALP